MVIDYAHTAEAFDFLLQTAREEGARRLFHVFGFRGHRDETKRQKMLDASVKWSDEVVLTVDDLNGLTTEELLNQYRKLQFSGTIVTDRTEAIGYAIERATKGDWIVITGKGLEPYRETYQLAAPNDEEAVFLCAKEKISLI